jgi:hypothetical protein
MMRLGGQGRPRRRARRFWDPTATTSRLLAAAMTAWWAAGTKSLDGGWYGREVSGAMFSGAVLEATRCYDWRRPNGSRRGATLATLRQIKGARDCCGCRGARSAGPLG